VEFLNKQGLPAIRFIFDSDGFLKHKAGYRLRNISAYEAGKEYAISVSLDASSRSYTVTVNNSKLTHGIFFQPVDGISRIMFRTGEQRYYPNPDTPVDTPDYDDVPFTGVSIPEAVFNIKSLITKKL